MLFDLTFPCYLTTFSGKNCLSGKIICAFFCPAYRSSPVAKYVECYAIHGGSSVNWDVGDYIETFNGIPWSIMAVVA
jgi:hypothetical protein